ncbi:MAG TPA: hypothetical protein VF754_09695 [Pyrinomonadaceae bacterium]
MKLSASLMLLLVHQGLLHSDASNGSSFIIYHPDGRATREGVTGTPPRARLRRD